MCGCVCVYVDDLDHHDSDCDSEKARNVACCQRKTYGISYDVTTFVPGACCITLSAWAVGPLRLYLHLHSARTIGTVTGQHGRGGKRAWEERVSCLAPCFCNSWRGVHGGVTF